MKFQEWELRAVPTFGSGGGSDLPTATIGRDLGSREIQVCSPIQVSPESMVALENSLRT